MTKEEMIRCLQIARYHSNSLITNENIDGVISALQSSVILTKDEAKANDSLSSGAGD
jgi:hypothetical protein